jgi:hypothetical protein
MAASPRKQEKWETPTLSHAARSENWLCDHRRKSSKHRLVIGRRRIDVGSGSGSDHEGELADIFPPSTRGHSLIVDAFKKRHKGLVHHPLSAGLRS